MTGRLSLRQQDTFFRVGAVELLPAIIIGDNSVKDMSRRRSLS